MQEKNSPFIPTAITHRISSDKVLQVLWTKKKFGLYNAEALDQQLFNISARSIRSHGNFHNLFEKKDSYFDLYGRHLFLRRLFCFPVSSFNKFFIYWVNFPLYTFERTGHIISVERTVLKLSLICLSLRK